jgi:tetratricopeptide (TPR) repeat protein
MLREAVELQRAGRAAEAVDAYRRLLARDPQQPECWFNLALLLRALRRLPEALDAYQRALETGVSRPEEAHLNRAVIYTDFLGEHAAAERELRAALALNPAFTPALLNLGNLCEDLGRREEALAAYERALAREPRQALALARIAYLQPPTAPSGPLVARLEAALARADLAPADRAALGFALGKLLDGAGEYPAAFAAYRAANAASRASAGAGGAHYDRARQEALVDALIAGGTAEGVGAAAAVAGPQPIFVCGMFRSGSTLAEQLLASLPGVVAGGELDILPRLVASELTPFPAALATLAPARLAALRARYLEELARIAPAARFVVDKRLDNFLHVGLIKSLFPAARIVHTVRAPLDNCLSMYFLHLDHGMPYALDLMDIGHHFREYRRLMQHWKRLFGADIHDLDYDALVRDPQPVLERACAFLGLAWQARPAEVPRAGGAIKTASVWQVREPLYRRSSGRAAHYATELAGLARYLAAAGIA